MSDKFTFIQIKPTTRKNVSDIIIDNVTKIINSKHLVYWNEDVKNLIDDLNDHIILHKEIDPVLYIDNFFKSHIRGNTNVDSFYNVIPFDIISEENKYVIMFTNNIINTSSYLNELSENDKNNLFNPIASSLIKYYSNNVAIFDDIFILSISKKYYDEINKIGTCNFKELKDIYYDYNPFNMLQSYARLYFIKIYIKQMNDTMYYSREILDNYVKNNKYKLSNNIIELCHENLILYIKCCGLLPNSHQDIMSGININQSTQIKNENVGTFYLTDITEEDIKKII